ncbi:MAG: nitroreductase family protein [Actinobacteria bacterium]|nr:nitroreductase family protein [Actinomycetota bacterium]
MSSQGNRSRLETTGFADAVNGRASVRKYAPDPVRREDVEAMVGIAVRAANAGNAQMWRFIAVEDEGLRAAMRQAVDEAIDEMAAWPEAEGLEKELASYRTYATFFGQAPLVLAVVARPYKSLADDLLDRRGLSREDHDRLRQRPDLQSLGAAIQLLCTAAHVLGYGTCWMTAPVIAAPAIETLLGVEPPDQLAAVVPVGRPLTPPRPSSRRPLPDVLEFR